MAFFVRPMRAHAAARATKLVPFQEVEALIRKRNEASLSDYDQPAFARTAVRGQQEADAFKQSSVLRLSRTAEVSLDVIAKDVFPGHILTRYVCRGTDLAAERNRAGHTKGGARTFALVARPK